jgi:hypothetical protein
VISVTAAEKFALSRRGSESLAREQSLLSLSSLFHDYDENQPIARKKSPLAKFLDLVGRLFVAVDSRFSKEGFTVAQRMSKSVCCKR